jgi:hypothetical protein
VARSYINFKTIDDICIVTLGYYISDTIKQPISAHVITDDHFDTRTFPKDLLDSRTLIKNSITNGNVT